MSTTPNTNETGAQFAAQQHLQTVKAQESIIHAQQLELERALQRVGQLEEALRQAGLLRVDGSLIDEGTKTGPVDPMDWPLPCDVKVGAGTNKKGTTLRVLVMRMETLHRMAMAALPPLTPQQQAAREALLATMVEPTGTENATPMKERRRFEERG